MANHQFSSTKPQPQDESPQQTHDHPESFHPEQPTFSATQRASHILGLQRMIGNRAVVQRMAQSQTVSRHPLPPLQWHPILTQHDAPQLARAQRSVLGFVRHDAWSASSAQREIDPVDPNSPVDVTGDDPYAEAEEEAKTLSNARFSGDKTLQKIVEGATTLGTIRNGAAVKAVQQALYDMSYPLPKYRVDGGWGKETEEAVRRFREDNGLEPGTDVDSKAMLALDRVAPPAGASANKSFDYDRLLADNKLTITLAIGYDEGGAHDIEQKRAQDFLLALEFTGASTDTGIDRYTKKHSFAVTEPSETQTQVRDVDVIVNVVTPHSKDAKDQFTNALTNDDVTIYSGHARYGTGPDFDDHNSPAQNFVLGVGSALHKAGVLKTPPGEDYQWYHGHEEAKKLLESRKNDLEKMNEEGAFDKEKYRVWFFNACTTLHYLDELRNPELAGQGNRKNTDIIGSRTVLPAETGIRAAQTFILSILQLRTLDELMGAMEGDAKNVLKEHKRGGDKVSQSPFFHDGFENNTEIKITPAPQ